MTNALTFTTSKIFPPITCQHLLTLDKQAEAIDYYLAVEVCEDLQQFDASLFYGIILLNQSLRQGHSRLDIRNLASTTYPVVSDIVSDVASDIVSNELEDPSNNAEVIFTFPPLDSLITYFDDLFEAIPDNSLVVYDEQALYLRRFWQYEERLAKTIYHLANKPTTFESGRIKSIVDALFPDVGDAIDWQKIAVCNSVLQHFNVIAGGPGTGKTTTVCKLLVVIIELLSQQGVNTPDIALVAPTGKAAQRLLESIQAKKQALTNQALTLEQSINKIPDASSTIHRLLGFLPHHYAFKFTRNNPLNIDILLVDEVSMIDLPLMTKLLDAVPEKTMVIMLGDPDQLPSVEVGSVLADIITRPHPGYNELKRETLGQLASLKIGQLPIKESANETHLDNCVTLLKESYRFKAGGEIGLLAASIIQGEVEKSWQHMQTATAEIQSNEQQYYPDENNHYIATRDSAFFSWLKPLVKDLFETITSQNTPSQALSIFSQFRVLAAIKNGPFGITAINLEIENYLLQTGLIKGQINPFYRANHQTAALPANYHGKPIMITENHYQTGLFNGDIGIIWQDTSNKLKAAFVTPDNDIKWVSLAKLPKHETVFAMTIHKTQGSEFSHVCMVLPEKPNRVLSRELIYTGVTRAKTQLTVFSSQYVWKCGVQKQIERNTGLKSKLEKQGRFNKTT